MASIPKPAFFVKLAAVFGLGALMLGAVAPAADTPSRPGQAEDWLVSGDPCFPVEQTKKFVRDNGGDPWYLECHPVQIEVTWDMNHVFTRGRGFPADRVKLRLRERFQGYLELDSNQLKRGELQGFQIQAPAPCCPGGVDAELEDISADLLVCDNWGEHCKSVSLVDPLLFEVTPKTNNFFGFTWNASGQASGGFGGSRIRLRPQAVQKPLSARQGADIASGSTLRIKVYNEDSLTYDELAQALKDGEYTKVFRSRNEGPVPGTSERDMTDVTAAVKLTFREPERERWRVTVTAWERDDNQTPIWYKDPASGADRKLPVVVDFDWKITAEVVLKKVKGRLQFEEGKVTGASVAPKLVFQGSDLYQCGFVDCPGFKSELAGTVLLGSVSGKNLKVEWPAFGSAACVLCRPLKSYLSKVPYRGTFGSPELMRNLSQQKLVLQSGYSTKGKVADWLTYTVALHKLK
jgi:hypothetical protein